MPFMANGNPDVIGEVKINPTINARLDLQC